MTHPWSISIWKRSRTSRPPWTASTTVTSWSPSWTSPWSSPSATPWRRRGEDRAPRCRVFLNRGTGDKGRGKRTGNPMDFPGNDGKMIENDGKMMGKCWENDGQWWENDGKMRKEWWTHEKNDGKWSKQSWKNGKTEGKHDEKHDGKHKVKYGYPQTNLIQVGKLFQHIHNPQAKCGHLIQKIWTEWVIFQQTMFDNTGGYWI